MISGNAWITWKLLLIVVMRHDYWGINMHSLAAGLIVAAKTYHGWMTGEFWVILFDHFI